METWADYYFPESMNAQVNDFYHLFLVQGAVKGDLFLNTDKKSIFQANNGKR
jgi:hypothetical protein